MLVEDFEQKTSVDVRLGLMSGTSSALATHAFSSLSRPSLFQGFYFLYKPFPCNSILWAKNCSCKQKKQNQANQSQKRLKKGSKSIGKSKKSIFRINAIKEGLFKIIKVNQSYQNQLFFDQKYWLQSIFDAQGRWLIPVRPSGYLTVCHGKWPIEIDGLPINSMVIFHGKLLNNQMVHITAVTANLRSRMGHQVVISHLAIIRSLLVEPGAPAGFLWGSS